MLSQPKKCLKKPFFEPSVVAGLTWLRATLSSYSLDTTEERAPLETTLDAAAAPTGFAVTGTVVNDD